MKFPIIVVYKDGMFARIRKSEVEKYIGSFLDKNHIRLKNAAKSSQLLDCIIDFEGKIYEITPEKTHRKWLSPLASIINLVAVDCKISDGKIIKIKELAELSKNWKNSYARYFRKFLITQNQEIIFDSDLFKAAWRHSYIDLPDEEWGEEVVG